MQKAYTSFGSLGTFTEHRAELWKSASLSPACICVTQKYTQAFLGIKNQLAWPSNWAPKECTRSSFEANAGNARRSNPVPLFPSLWYILQYRILHLYSKIHGTKWISGYAAETQRYFFLSFNEIWFSLASSSSFSHMLSGKKSRVYLEY